MAKIFSFVDGASGVGNGKWTKKLLSEKLVVDFLGNDACKAPFNGSFSFYGCWPAMAFNPLKEGDLYDYGLTKTCFCPELLVEPRCLAEDAWRILDDHGYSKYWQQWKVKNAIVSMTMISGLILALALDNSSLLDNEFPLGNCLPRTILFPFTGREGKGNRHRIVDDSCLPSEYNASSFNTLSFIERSEEMTPRERWENGNISGEYLRVAKKVSNFSETERRYDSASGKWKYEKTWISKQNLYSATDRMKHLVSRARNGELRFIELDCKDIRKWFIESYVDHATGKLRKALRLNARQDFPGIWKEWTGLRPSNDLSASVEGYATFSSAMNACQNEIMNGSLVWTTHLEKILRGLFLGSKKGQTIQELMEQEKGDVVKAPIVLATEKPLLPVIGKDSLEVNVQYSKDAVEEALKTSQDYSRAVVGQLQALLANGKNWNGSSWMRLHFRRRRHGRYYGYGNCVQAFPKQLRRSIFPSYDSIDLNCGVYSIMMAQLTELGYKGSIDEMKSMVSDKNAYRQELVNQELGISINDVKEYLTMIGYGCTINIQKIVDAAEWNWLVEAYSIEPTLYDTYHYAPGTALAGGVNDPKRLMQIAEWASNPKVLKLWNEMQEGGNFLFKKMKKVENGRPVLCNAWGEEMDIKSKRVSFGQKLAHIYQGSESMVLWSIMDGFKIDGNEVKLSPFGFGLPMHDGFGLHKEIAGEKAFNLVETYVKERTGWSLNYECE